MATNEDIEKARREAAQEEERVLVQLEAARDALNRANRSLVQVATVYNRELNTELGHLLYRVRALQLMTKTAFKRP